MSYLKHLSRSNSQAQLEKQQLNKYSNTSNCFLPSLPRAAERCVVPTAQQGETSALPNHVLGEGGKWQTQHKGEILLFQVRKVRLLKGYIYPVFLLTLETVQSY